MGNRQWIRLFLALGTSLVVLVGCVVLYNSTNLRLLPIDHAHDLSPQKEIIEVSYINWACDCAEWKVSGEEIPEDSLEHYSIFIEGSESNNRYELTDLADNCWPVKMKLTGRYYLDKGISRDYDVMHEKPDKARVFRYDQFEILETQCHIES